MLSQTYHSDPSVFVSPPPHPPPPPLPTTSRPHYRSKCKYSVQFYLGHWTNERIKPHHIYSRASSSPRFHFISFHSVAHIMLKQYPRLFCMSLDPIPSLRSVRPMLYLSTISIPGQRIHFNNQTPSLALPVANIRVKSAARQTKEWKMDTPLLWLVKIAPGIHFYSSDGAAAAAQLNGDWLTKWSSRGGHWEWVKNHQQCNWSTSRTKCCVPVKWWTGTQ